jgi:hypothetical protein
LQRRRLRRRAARNDTCSFQGGEFFFSNLSLGWLQASSFGKNRPTVCLDVVHHSMSRLGGRRRRTDQARELLQQLLNPGMNMVSTGGGFRLRHWHRFLYYLFIYLFISAIQKDRPKIFKNFLKLHYTVHFYMQ